MKALVLCALGGVFLPDMYARQAKILGFNTAALPVVERMLPAALLTEKKMAAPTLPKDSEVAYFAAGAHTYAEAIFEHEPGVYSATPGSMADIHTVQVVYDPRVMTYKQLLATYWDHIDPTDPEGQFNDRGMQYRSAIFYEDGLQKISARASFQKVKAVFGNGAVTELLPAETFTAAGANYQDYAVKYPDRFTLYLNDSGRADILPMIQAALRGQSS